MQDAKEEVRSRLNIEDVIGEYVQLKRAGRNFKGLSPFSGEKTPSFVVSPEKHIWHDFSSGKGGDVFSFIMEVEGHDFRGALELLARKAGVDLSMYQTAGSKKLAIRKKRILEAHSLTARYYQASLVKNKQAAEYVFKKRKFNKESVTEFQIGYAPDSGDALVNFLTKRGFKREELRDAGLINQYGGDLFRGRMMVPLMDGNGQTIGFTARVLMDAPNAPKYLNTPATLLYDKSRHVFGLSQAKQAIRENDEVIMVEGNLDVTSSHQAGVKQVVATAGTALTEHHLRALYRLTGNVRLAFDADKAGLSATERAIGIASDIGIDLTIVVLPDDFKDPDELIQHDISLWKSAIADAQPAVDWVLARYAEREDLDAATGKRNFTTAALAVVARLSDAVERDHYVRKIADMIGSSKDAIESKLATSKDPEQDRMPKKVVNQSAQSSEIDQFIYEDAALAIGLSDSGAQDLFHTIEPSLFHGEDRQTVAKYISKNPGAISNDIPRPLQKVETYVKILLLKAETRYADWDAQHRYYEAAELLRRIQTENKKQQKIELQQALRDAEQNGDDKTISSILSEISSLDKEITRGKK